MQTNDNNDVKPELPLETELRLRNAALLFAKGSLDQKLDLYVSVLLDNRRKTILADPDTPTEKAVSLAFATLTGYDWDKAAAILSAKSSLHVETELEPAMVEAMQAGAVLDILIRDKVRQELTQYATETN